ncbi:MAG: Glucanase [Candidatus Saccharibacteria bacterium]|nr:Glucanase [Candidatus Saccharibacteria bacterium]
MTKTFIVRFIAAILILSGVSAAAYATFRSSDSVDKNIVFSDRTLLSGLWDNYKKVYWEKDTGRTLDRQQDNVTTSEGQSYTMLRAVWQSDRATFDRTWAWTQEQLDRPEDTLFAWRWGKKADGSYGILRDMGGQNTASDADSDIALALVMAASRWQKQSYLNQASAIIKDIWKQEVISVKGTPYLVSNNLEKDSQKPAIINPSYLAPYAYRIFAKVDKADNWDKLVTSSYDIINTSMTENLDKNSSAAIVPDWISVDKTTGAIDAIKDTSSLTTNYGFDAMRTPFRLALDYQWNKDDRAKDTLSRMSFFKKQWDDKGKIVSTYSHDGGVVKNEEVAETYATLLGYFSIVDPQMGDEIYNKKLEPLYNQNTNSWTKEMTYYGDNWSWFGIALHENKLDNIAADLR